jgi:hypothetical protein
LLGRSHWNGGFRQGSARYGKADRLVCEPDTDRMVALLVFVTLDLLRWSKCIGMKQADEIAINHETLR